MQLTLGPNLYFWPRQRVFDFYREVEQWPVDRVYLGEVVCPKRRELRAEDWLAIAEALAAAGKEVVLSSLALLEARSDMLGLQRVIDNGRFAIEANDMAAVHLASSGGRFVAGPHLNVYNGETLALLHEVGARRWVMPLELSAATLEGMQAARPAGMETEVFAWGRMPLAFSARCFTARAHDLPKDDCQWRCRDDADGLLLETREREAFLVVNGIQTQSAHTCNLIDQVPAMRRLGVDALRLSPQSQGMAQVVETFRAVIDGALDPSEGERRLQGRGAGAPCNGYWFGEAGMDWRAPAAP